MANLSAFGGAQPITPGGLVELGHTNKTSAATYYSTTATSPDTFVEVTVVCDGGPVLVEAAGIFGSVSSQTNVALWRDGSELIRYWGTINSASVYGNPQLRYRDTPSAGSHTYTVRIWNNAGGYTNTFVNDPTVTTTSNGPGFIRVSKIVQQNDGLKPFWKPPITASLPSNPDTGDQIIYKHGGTGNIGSHLPMIYDGTKWQPMGEAVLCRWNCGSASQVFSSTSITNVTVGDYNTVTFTPPWDGYYEISQKTGMWELNSGIGMYTNFSATDGSAHHTLQYIQDWNGPYQHHREGHGMPIVYYLYSAKTYRFTGVLTYASGNTGTINFFGTAHVRALSR